MMKQIILFLAILLLPLMAVAAGTPIDQANEAYKKQLYNDALKLYLQVERQSGTSSELCCNIGDTYYRLKDTPHAILYYERALLLNPSNSDARYNLQFVRERANLHQQSGDTWFSDWLDETVSRLSSNAWAVTAIVSFLLFLVALVVYLFMDNVLARKIGFFSGIVLLLLAIAGNVCAFYVHGKAVDRTGAVLMTETTLSKVPRHPKGEKEQSQTLAAGIRVAIVDSVAAKGQPTWLQVTAPNGEAAWLPAEKVEVI